MGESLLPQLYVSLVGLLRAPGTAFPGVSLGRASGVFFGLTKARLVRIFVGLEICLLGLVAWLVDLLVNLRV